MRKVEEHKDTDQTSELAQASLLDNAGIQSESDSFWMLFPGPFSLNPYLFACRYS